jgi:quinol-cytochrome oxidoreductase complex cytochrome b subunit
MKSRIAADKPEGWVRRVVRSVFPHSPIPRTASERLGYPRRLLLLHFRPATVPADTLRLSLSWGLGGAAAWLILLQMGSGALLTFVYVPTPLGAFHSVELLGSEVPFGRLVRNLHHWCANLLVPVVFLHMLRVFYTGAHRSPRQFNWVVGLALFTTVLMANFTGYLLPWDQLAYWAVTVSTGMLTYIPFVGPEVRQYVQGGPEIGAETLRLFFALHSGAVPAALMVLMAFHFWRVRKAGGLVAIGAGRGVSRPKLPVVPHLLVREAAMAAVVSAVVLLMSVFFDAPLAGAANPGLSPNPTKAPWYFAGFQELLLHIHPTAAVCIIPSLLVGFALAIPYIAGEARIQPSWFISATGRRTALLSAIAGAAGMIATVVLGTRIDNVVAAAAGLPPVVSRGLLPVAGALAAVAGWVWWLKSRYHTDRGETLQAVFTALAAALVVLTIVGAVFRGENMGLRWP